MFNPTIAAIRFGYGLSPLHPAPREASDLLAPLAGPDTTATAVPVEGFDDLMPAMRAFRVARRARDGSEDAEKAFDKEKRNIRRMFMRGAVAQVKRAVGGADAFRERLQFFWADHFTVRSTAAFLTPGPSAFIEDAIRPHITGRFADMLRAAVTHPVMLIYLDQHQSVGPASAYAESREAGLNENLAREVLELHTLGVEAGYSQDDVREFAELLTGLGFNVEKGFVFRAQRAEPGAETVLGRSYGSDGRQQLDDVLAALDDIAAHPATARHIARKLAVHFVSDTPDEDLVAHVAEAFRASDGHLPTVYAALVEHPAAWAPLGAKVRQPWDYVAAALRALGTDPARLDDLASPEFRRAILAPLADMGQAFQRPGGPDGWPEEAEAWITPAMLAARMQWAMDLSRLHGDDLPDPRDFVHSALGEAASTTLITAAAQAENRREGVGLILASADFNRR